MSIVLVGAGPDTTRSDNSIKPFIEACTSRKASRIGLFPAGRSYSAEHFAPDCPRLLDGVDVDIEIVSRDGGTATSLASTHWSSAVGRRRCTTTLWCQRSRRSATW